MKKVIELNSIEARGFFLKESCYYNFDLPKYFQFNNLLDTLSNALSDTNLEEKFRVDNTNPERPKKLKPSDFEDVNYKFLNNKDGKFSWRPLQLIHPVIYISLVNKITESDNWAVILSKFEEFRSNPKIRCYSLPIESEESLSDKASSVAYWWQSIEQQSIELGLKYDFILHTDISNCYSSFYTHSIPWAIHTKEVAKEERRNKNLVGNNIDWHLQMMTYAQTNGIPQGSVLMDFIAEIILGYADTELSNKINSHAISDYEIIRYRDDYRIFSNNVQTVEKIAKLLTEVLINLGLSLNPEKTIVSSDIVSTSIKPDKLYWFGSKHDTSNLQHDLLNIHQLSKRFPNSGSLVKALNQFYPCIDRLINSHTNISVLSSILVDIMIKNPKCFPIATAILSKLISHIPNQTKQIELINLILKKLDKVPNTGYLKIWMQRITIKLDPSIVFDEKICGKLVDPSISIWNSNWLSEDINRIINTTEIVNHQVVTELDAVIKQEEVELFKREYSYSSDVSE